jgi:hypothetical protein
MSEQIVHITQKAGVMTPAFFMRGREREKHPMCPWEYTPRRAYDRSNNRPTR